MTFPRVLAAIVIGWLLAFVSYQIGHAQGMLTAWVDCTLEVKQLTSPTKQ